MDLGIAGLRAIVCAASKGLGKGCAMSLARNGVHVVINARTRDVLERTGDEIRAATGVDVTCIAADVTTPEGRAALLAACPEPDILVNNAGGPPPGDFHDWTAEDWRTAVNANMITPIELIRATIDAMAGKGFGRVVNITSSAVKAPIAELGLSNGARAGLTGFVAGTSRAMAYSGVTINNILPGRFDTDRLRTNLRRNAEQSGKPLAELESAAKGAIPAKRFGTADEFGELCAFLCSRQAGYITGQNLLIDGGMVNSTL